LPGSAGKERGPGKHRPGGGKAGERDTDPSHSLARYQPIPAGASVLGETNLA
jgi:hypothetical protein